MQFQRLRGTYDIYGSQAQQVAMVEEKARQIFARFGYEEIRTPIIEDRDLFKRALGQETDVVQKEMYEFVDRSDSWICLRPEGTAGVVRAYLENNFDKTAALSKLYYMGPMFRAERPQAGRQRQFHQIGVEILGSKAPLSDAEAISSLCVFLEAVGAAGYTLKLNNIGSSQERDQFRLVLKDYFREFAELMCSDCQRRYEKNVYRLLDCKNPKCREYASKAPLMTPHLSRESRDHFDQVLAYLDKAGIAYKLEPNMVRGLDYYTKTVFELTHPKLGAQDALAAGGRYDTLVETFGGPDTGCFGYAMGLERLLMAISEQALQDQEGFGVFAAVMGDAPRAQMFRICHGLRTRGVRVLMDAEAKSLKSQMRSADKAKATLVLILGDDELASGTIQIKDLRTGQQSQQSIDGLYEYILALQQERL